MKKSIIALCMIAVFCFASVAAAAASPFSDVPANHWAYGAVNKLAKAGIIDGFGTNFQGDKTLTRYEMAQIVANAMTKEDKASAENKALIEKLAKEFAGELQALGVRVTALENKANDFRYFGLLGNRYDHKSDKGVTDRSNVFNFWSTYKVNNFMTVETQSEFHRMYTSNVGTGSAYHGTYSAYTDSVMGTTDWNQLFMQSYAKFNFDGTTAKMGRFTYMPAYGLVHGDYQEVSGALVSFGSTLKTTLVVGQNTAYVPGGTLASTVYKSADVAFALTPKANVKAAYMKNDTVNYVEGGFDTRLGQDYGFEAAYVKSNATDNNKGYYAKLQYKAAIPFVAKTYDVFVTYHNLEDSSIIGNDIPLAANRKGVRYGFHYAPWDSTLLTVFYDNAKYIIAEGSAKAGDSQNFFRAQLDIFFK